ncbi:MAG TPA: hypothetical protein VEO95_10430 [Chthoniobacteraceae bacterium]|nr:hypothetical protein [Chthoniobacteraceae bacterium]
MNARAILIFACGATLALRAEPVAETPPEEPREAAKREAWTCVTLITSLLEQGDTTAFPGIRTWLEDFHRIAANTPPPESGKPFPPIDTDALVTRNAHFWTAFYEVQPGDPGLALLHAALLLSGGEAQRAAALAAFGLQRPGIPEEIKRGLESILAHCQTAQARSATLVSEGMKLHDRRDFAGALACYERALADWPANGAAFAERGLTFRAKAACDARERAKAQQSASEDPTIDPPETTAAFAEARKHDPFNLLAYQGDDPAMLTGLMALVRSGLPVWEAIRRHPELPARHDHLRALSEACRDAGIDDFALVLRQLVVTAMRRYQPTDQQLIGECVQRLAPAAFTAGVLARIGGETRMPARQIVIPLVVEPPDLTLAKADDSTAPETKKPEPGAKSKGKGKSAKSKRKIADTEDTPEKPKPKGKKRKS